MTDNVPPNNIQAEESTLGAMILRPSSISDALEMLEGEDFYREQHRMIFEVLTTLYSTGKPTDHVTIADELKRRGQLETIGNLAYLARLSADCPVPENVGYYAAVVREMSMRRKLIEAGYSTAVLGNAIRDDLEEQLSEAEAAIYSVGDRLRRESMTHISGPVETSIKRLHEVRESGSRITGIPTGFRELDAVTCGMQPSNLIIIGGRTSMGKTSLALNIAYHVGVTEGKGVLVFSLEMNRVEVAERLVLRDCGLDSGNYRSGNVTQHELEKVHQSARIISGAPIYVDDEGDRSLTEIRSIARRRVTSEHVELVIVDYIQLLYGEKRTESRAQEVSKIARTLKVMAMELAVPVIACSQLRRPSPGITRKEPHLEDLKESGGIEQNADLVLLIYRPEVDEPENLDLKALADVHLAKHRNGKTTMFRLFWTGGSSSFLNPRKEESYGGR